MMVIAGDWWSPVTWLQSVGGFFQGAYNAGGAVLNVLGGALTILTQFFRFFLDTGPFIADAVNWVTQTLFPPELQTWFLGTIGQPGQRWNSTQISKIVSPAGSSGSAPSLPSSPTITNEYGRAEAPSVSNRRTSGGHPSI